MRIPTLLKSDLALALDALRSGSRLDPKVTYVGLEGSLDNNLVDGLVSELLQLHGREIKKLTKSKEKKYKEFELAATPVLLKFFAALPSSCKFSPGFFAYLSFRLQDVIVWRYPPNDGGGWPKNFVATQTPSDFVDGFLPRLVIHGLIAKGSPVAESLIAQDFWRSHVLRVKTGFSSAMSQAFAEEKVESGTTTNEERRIARLIQSVRSNVIFEVLSKKQARQIVRNLRL